MPWASVLGLSASILGPSSGWTAVLFLPRPMLITLGSLGRAVLYLISCSSLLFLFKWRLMARRSAGGTPKAKRRLSAAVSLI